jgi:proteasome accessory factor B
MAQAAKFQRWVDLIATLLAHHAPVTFDRIEREVPGYAGKSKATQKRMFERDKRELKALGVPIESIGEEGSDESAYRMATKDFYLPYLAVSTPRGLSKPPRVDKYGYRALMTLAFEPDELEVVAEAAQRARALGDPMLVADVDSAMRKLAFDLPIGAVSQPGATHLVAARDRPDPQVLEQLGQALLARKGVELHYRSMSSDTSARRRAEPYGLFFLDAHWYLAARDLDRDGVRNFRVSRISDVSVNTAREDTPDYDIPKSFQLREHARSRHPWELGEGDALEAIVELRRDSGAAIAAAALGEAIAGNPRQRRFQVRRVDAFARWLLSFAGDAVPVVPPILVDEYHRQVHATLALYASPGVSRAAARAQ